MITFRISWALSGISRPSAFSTARTEAMACTVVQTPQMRCVNTQASRGSRPFRISSKPRHIVPLDRAAVHLHVDAEVALDARDRVDGDPLRHGVTASFVAAAGTASGTVSVT